MPLKLPPDIFYCRGGDEYSLRKVLRWAILLAAVIGIAFVLVLSRLWGITGVWLTMPCTELITFLVSLVLLKRIKKSRLSQERPLVEQTAAAETI